MLCTCTWLEVMTAVGVSGYLLFLGEFTLSLVAILVFSKVIVFHFIIDYYDKRKRQPVASKNQLI